GSIYALLWVAFANLRAPFVEADGTLACDIANILRCPDSGESLTHFTLIIPTIETLGRLIPIQLGEVLSPQIVSALGLQPSSLCSELNSSDRLFSSLPTKYVLSHPSSHT
ncbi:hypothetical protein FOMPIDRAFT_62802, partial [Fomitopsis schrenkii]